MTGFLLPEVPSPGKRESMTAPDRLRPKELEQPEEKYHRPCKLGREYPLKEGVRLARANLGKTRPKTINF